MNIEELLNKQESLCEELKSYLTSGSFGKMICHPLVYDIFYTEQQNAVLNARLKWKKEMLAKYKKEKEWSSYIFTYERPYRLEAFMSIALKVSNKKLWPLLRSIWIDSENIWQNQKLWESLLNANHPNSKYFMTKEERKVLDNLPEKIIVYRGYIKDMNEDGQSYTLSKKVAKKITMRAKSSLRRVKKRVVSKKEIFAYVNGRKEEEIILRGNK